MQHRQEEQAFQRQFVTPPGEQSLDDLGNSQFLPQPPEDQCRSDATTSNGGDLPIPMSREHQDGFRESGSRLQQAIELPTFLQLIQAPQRGQDALFAASVLPTVFDNLQVLVGTGSLAAYEHGSIYYVSVHPN